jgi:hypothetical protein
MNRDMSRLQRTGSRSVRPEPEFDFAMTMHPTAPEEFVTMRPGRESLVQAAK